MQFYALHNILHLLNNTVVCGHILENLENRCSSKEALPAVIFEGGVTASKLNS